MGRVKDYVMSGTMDDMVLPEPTTEAEMFSRWCNYFSASMVAVDGKKINIK